MESVISHVYILPRQLFGPDRLAGPAGLARYLGRPCGEDGCYAISFRGDSIHGAVVYGTTQAYDCFVPVCEWSELGPLSAIRGFQVLAEKYFAIGRPVDLSFWDFVTGGHYRLMYAMQAAATVVYLRLRSARMPENYFVVYRLYGIALKDEWWRAEGYAYLGILDTDAADAQLDTE